MPPVLGQWQAWASPSLADGRSVNFIYLHLSAYFRAKCGPGMCLLRKGASPNVPIGLVLFVGSCPPVLGQWEAWPRTSLAAARSLNLIYLHLSAYFRAKCGPGTCLLRKGTFPNVPIGLVLLVGSCPPVLGQWQAWSRPSLADGRSVNFIYLLLSAYFRAKCGPGTCLLRKGASPNVPIGLVLFVGSCAPVLGQWEAWARTSLAAARSLNLIYLHLSAYFRAKCGPGTCLLRKGTFPNVPIGLVLFFSRTMGLLVCRKKP